MRILLLLILLSSLFAAAQPRLEKHFAHKLYTTYEGLAQSQVTYLMQDSKGYIWFCTKGGLTRYDGKEFINFIDENDGTRVNITSILETPLGFVLSSARKMWLFNYEEENPTNWSFRDFDKINDFKILNDFTYLGGRKYYHPGDSCVYMFNLLKDFEIDTSKHHVKFQLFTNKTYTIAHTNELVLFTHQTNDNNYFFTTDSLYVTFGTTTQQKPLPGRFNCYGYDPYYKSIVAYSKIEKIIYRLHEPFKEKIELASNFEMNSYDYTHLSTINHNDYAYFSLNNELNTLNGKNLGRVTFPRQFLTDREGNFWVVSENGVYNFYKAGFEEYRFNIGNSVDNVWSIVSMPDSSMWFGGYMTGLWSLSKNDKLIVHNPSNFLKTKSYDNFQLNFYMGGITDKDNRGYLPVNEGFLKIERNKTTHYKLFPKDMPMSITDDTIHNCLLIGTARGAALCDKKTMKLIDYRFTDRSIVSTCIKDDGTYLVGSFVSQYIYKNSSLVPYHPERNRGAISMTKDFQGNIWKGTMLGLFLDNDTSETEPFPDKIKGMIASVFIQHPYIMAATINKLYIVNIDSFYSNPQTPVYEFNSGNGYIAMDGGQNGFCADREGKIWYTVTDKVLRFSPEDLVTNYSLYTPKPHFAAFHFSSDQLTWHRVEPTDSLRLLRKWNENSIRFNMKAVSISYADNLVYQYRIKQLSPEWSEPTKETQQSFSKLKPGKYQIEIRCSCHNGIWSETVTSPVITIKRAWWNYWWAKVFYALFTAGGIILITVYIVKQRQKYFINRLTEQKRLNELRLQSVRSKHIPHFSGNALANIEHFIFSADLRTANKYLSKYSRLMNVTLRDADKASRSIDEELEYVNLYLELEKMRFGDKIEYFVTIDKQVDTKKEIPNMLLQTWVENAIKHGLRNYQGTGRINIFISKKDETTIIQVEDNGIGRAKAKELKTTGTGSGLKILTEQIEIYNHFNPRKAIITITDLSDNDGNASGTRIEMSIPDDYQFNIQTSKQIKN